jgi:hypothetical protein
MPSIVNSDDSQLVSTQALGVIQVLPTIYPNILRNYTSFSPIIALQVTNTNNYNEMIANQLYDASKWNTICQSGGVGAFKATGFPPNQTQYFSRDLYIDDIIIETLCGLSQANRGSNATNIEFTIVEPFGMDFIEQLYDYCHNALNEFNYCDIPYLLKISFQGYQQDGSLLPIASATKYIPIRLANMEIKVSNLGATYKITAFAYNELALTEQYGRIPAPIENTYGQTPAGIEVGPGAGTANVGGPIPTVVGMVGSTTQTTAAPTSIWATTQVNNQGLWQAAGARFASTGGGTIRDYTEALAGALNNIQKALLNVDITPKILIRDTYKINYDTSIIDIGKSSFIDEIWGNSENPPVQQDAPMGTPVVSNINSFNLTTFGQNVLAYAVDHTTGTTGSGAITYIKGGKVVFNSGSSILDCLNTLIINSSYITAQIASYNNQLYKINTAINANPSNSSSDPTVQADVAVLENTPLNWFKIITTITNGQYDAGRQTYSKNIVYTIKPYKIFNSTSLSAWNGNPLSQVVKEYDYIFTGKNTEVLDFDLNFNNAFLVYAQFNNPTKTQATGGKMPDKPQVPPIPVVNKNVALQSTSTAYQDGRSSVIVSSSNKMGQGAGTMFYERNQAADIASTIYSIGDQIELNITIQGDPDFIKQDGIFLSPYSSNIYTNAGQGRPSGILFDSGEIYANINFKVPQDINLSTGTLDLAFDGDIVSYDRNVFSGQYRILQVTNKFNKGWFTQQIDCIRFNSKDFTVGSNSTTTAVVSAHQGASDGATASAAVNVTVPSSTGS